MITCTVKTAAKSLVSVTFTHLFGDANGHVALRTLGGPAKGLKFALDLRRLEYAYWLGKYDRPILQALAAIIKPGWTIWDCGTYLGFYTCFFARLVGPTGHVVAFEPDPVNLRRTQHNVLLNQLDGIVSFRPYAIGGPNCEVDFLLSPTTNSHLRHVYVGASRDAYAKAERVDSVIKVRSVSLDEIHADQSSPRPDLIKLDIEGAEVFALDHVLRICAEARPRIVLELHNGECDRAAWEWSRKVGYELVSLDTGEKFTDPACVRGTLLCIPPC